MRRRYVTHTTQGRVRRRRRGLTRPDKAPAVVGDPLRRDFTAELPDRKWVGDFKQENTDEGPVFLATVEDLFSRRMLGFATSDSYPTAQLATAAINMAAAARGGDVAGGPVTGRDAPAEEALADRLVEHVAGRAGAVDAVTGPSLRDRLGRARAVYVAAVMLGILG